MSLTIKTICTEKWRLHDLTTILDAIEDEVAGAISEKQIRTANDYMNIVLRIAGKSFVGIREITYLSACGYPDGALSLARNLYEHVIILAFFENHQMDDDFINYVEDYHTDYDIQRIKAWIYDCKYCSQNPVELQKLNDELNQIKKDTHREVKRDYWWSGNHTFNDLVTSAINSVADIRVKHFLHMLHLAYKRACVSIHSSCIGNTLRLGAELDFAGIDTSPTSNGHALPLWLSTVSFMYIMGVTYNKLELPYDFNYRKLDELAKFFFKEEF